MCAQQREWAVGGYWGYYRLGPTLFLFRRKDQKLRLCDWRVLPPSPPPISIAVAQKINQSKGKEQLQSAAAAYRVVMSKLWKWYQQCLALHPVKTQIISSGILWGLGDIGAQKITHSITLNKQQFNRDENPVHAHLAVTY